jgi:hypothetical protein
LNQILELLLSDFSEYAGAVDALDSSRREFELPLELAVVG